MFNVQGSELIFLVLIALLVLGPEKLPDAIRKAGRLYGEFRKIANGFQSEIRSALDEPVRELQKTADLVRDAATFDVPGRKHTPPGTTVHGSSSTAQRPSPSTSPATPAASGPAPAAPPERPPLNFGQAADRRPAPSAPTTPTAPTDPVEGSAP